MGARGPKPGQNKPETVVMLALLAVAESPHWLGPLECDPEIAVRYARGILEPLLEGKPESQGIDPTLDWLLMSGGACARGTSVDHRVTLAMAAVISAMRDLGLEPTVVAETIRKRLNATAGQGRGAPRTALEDLLATLSVMES